MRKRDVLKHVELLAILSICFSVGLNTFLLLINLPRYSERYQEVVATLYAPSFWQQILISGLIIPVIEELLFRGVVFRVVRRWIAFPWAMIISTVMFGAYHGNLVQFVYAGLCGMVLAYFYEKYSSILVPIFSHAVMNIVALVITRLGVLTNILKSNISATIVLLFCGVCSIVVFLGLQKMDVTKVLKIYCKETGNDI